MRPVYAAMIILSLVVLLTSLSCSTRDKNRYWNENTSALYNIVSDANTNLSKANTSSGDRPTRLRYAAQAKAYLCSAREMATDSCIQDVLKIDAVKMKKEIDKTYARISGGSAGRGLRGRRTKRATPDRRPSRFRY